MIGGDTYIQKGHIIFSPKKYVTYSRINSIFISESQIPQLDKIDFAPVIISDHDPIKVICTNNTLKNKPKTGD